MWITAVLLTVSILQRIDRVHRLNLRKGIEKDLRECIMHRTMGTKAQIVSAPEDFEVLLETFWIEHQFQKAPIPIFYYFPCSKYLTILPCGCNECSVRPNERSHIHTKFIVIPFIGVRKSKWALILKLINHFKRRFTLQFTRISSIQNYSNSYHI